MTTSSCDVDDTTRRLQQRPLRFLVLSALASSFTAGCGSDNSAPAKAASAEVLDPTVEHYGSTDDVWGALWWKWVYELPQTTDSCVIPFEDPTGEHCADGQSGDVFFLAGTTANVAVRTKCAVPSGKAIFFPILNFTVDNAGVAADQVQSDDKMIAFVKKQLDGAPIAEMSAQLDDLPITDLARFRTEITKFDYTLPEEPNTYTCLGATGVTGKVDPAYAAGFYVMLPPPEAGAHVLQFAGHAPDFSPPLDVDVTYRFTIR